MDKDNSGGGCCAIVILMILCFTPLVVIILPILPILIILLICGGCNNSINQINEIKGDNNTLVNVSGNNNVVNVNVQKTPPRKMINKRLNEDNIECDIECMYMSMNPEQRKRADVIIHNFGTNKLTVAIRCAEIIVDPENQFYNDEHFFNK